ncbi:Multidrug resistance-associated protein 9 [Trichoplax sp. H2]|nr:Multidrug resistance-associated protein 9 [Trichoplax sp. H2]|eukprot:RDD46569.1 Multidrug resistance-associated protein 9 [Trichoplax sp. H2]
MTYSDDEAPRPPLAPYVKANILSKLSIWWVSKLVITGYKKPIDASDIWPLPEEELVQANYDTFDKLWNEELKTHGKEKASIARVFIIAFRKRLLLTFLLYCFVTALSIGSSAFGLVGIEITHSVFYGFTWYSSYITGIRARSMAFGLVFHKIVRLRSASTKSMGELVNMCANDAQRVFLSMLFFGISISIPIIAIALFAAMIYIIGPVCLVAAGVFLVSMMSTIYFGKYIKKLRCKSLLYGDQRVQLISEIIRCIKLIKMFTWESSFQSRVNFLRGKESRWLEKIGYISRFTGTYIVLVPAVAISLTFLTNSLLGLPMTSAKAFTVMLLLNGLRLVIDIFPLFASHSAETLVAFQRFKKLLLMNEIEATGQVSSDSGYVICIKDAEFIWEKVNEGVDVGADVFSLKSINLEVPKGQVLGACGRVGSGKSSLVSAILGEMICRRGEIRRGDSIAVVTQQPWIFNETLRENILFGSKYDSKRYYDVLSACCLTADLKCLIAGDRTLIGDRGINLSGGQKQRVSLARAVYADKEVYLLDDPLSAVDTDVGEKIFHRCIKGLLRSKTVLLVTHQLQYLTGCDSVLLLENGIIAARGTHDELIKKSKGYRELVENLKSKKDKESHETVGFRESTSTFSSIKSDEFVAFEKTSDQGVDINVYLKFFNACGGLRVLFLLLLMYIAITGCRVFSDWWLARWINDSLTVDVDSNRTLTDVWNSSEPMPPIPAKSSKSQIDIIVYGLLALINVLLFVLKAICVSKIALKGSSSLCMSAFQKILSAPMSFFDTTPSGKIINRFSRDLDEVDTQLVFYADRAISLVLLTVATLTIVSISYPWILLAVFPMIFVTGALAYIFNKTNRELKRLDNASRAPVMTHLTATVEGLTTVHAFNKVKQQVEIFQKYLDKNSSIFLTYWCVNRWVAIRADWIAIALVAICCILVTAQRGLAPSAYAGLALSYVLQLKGLIQLSVRYVLDVNSRFTAVERLIDYTENLETEGLSTYSKPLCLPDKWLKHGHISFSNVKVRYRPNLPIVLNRVTFSINAQERIGIIGRTGSGKSSLMACLFRLTEIESGKICIDGIDIRDIGIKNLRSSLSMIPQDPFLFANTLRFNLLYCNQFIIIHSINSMTDKLYTNVFAGGSNFSLGERQLLCLARVLLKPSKILMLDEATAFMDTKTDAIIQQTLIKEFKGSTVLVVAHRLNTVLNCDRILALSAGKVVEFDTPRKLMKRRTSKFKELIIKGGIDYESWEVFGKTLIGNNKQTIV